MRWFLTAEVVLRPMFDRFLLGIAKSNDGDATMKVRIKGYTTNDGIKRFKTIEL